MSTQKGPEAKYARAPLAKMFNSTAFCKWIKNENFTYLSKTTSSESIAKPVQYESGRPDGFVFYQGRIACIECKAGRGKLFLGNPDNKAVTAEWSRDQRN